MYASERIDDKISKDTANELNLDFNLVDKVIRFQFKTANEATTLSSSIELTDLGTFKTPRTKLDRKLKTLYRKLEIKKALSLNPDVSERRRTAASLTCSTITENIEYLTKKKLSYENRP